MTQSNEQNRFADMTSKQLAAEVRRFEPILRSLLQVETAEPRQVDAEPIQDWENRQAKGDAMICKAVRDKHLSKVAELRERQEAYEASLPQDPTEALKRINRALKDIGDVLEPHYGARASLEIFHQLAAYGALEDLEHIEQSVYWLSWQGIKAMDAIDQATNEALAISRQFHASHRPFEA